MRRQDFGLIRGELLETLEGLVVAEHRAIFADLREEAWSRPRAYGWMRYEDADPAGRLLEASAKLADEWADSRGRPGWPEARARFEALEAPALRRAEALARQLGFRSEPEPAQQ